MNKLENDTWEEEHAIFKQPKRGKCKHSKFVNGYHRIGFIPHTCHNDGGLKGMSCHCECLDCGRKFNKSIFVI